MQNQGALARRHAEPTFAPDVKASFRCRPGAANRSSAVMTFECRLQSAFRRLVRIPGASLVGKYASANLIQHVAFLTSVLDRFVRMALVIT